MEAEFYFYRNSKNIMYICRDCGGKKESEIFRGTQIYIKGCGVSGESKRAAVYSMYIVNPSFFCLSSHGSRSYETSLQSRPRWKMKTIMVSVCASVRPNTPREIIQNRAARRIFTFFPITSPVGLRFEFWKDWLNPQSMLIPNLFCLFWMFASKGFKSS
jgi:hypothetical protein